MGNKTSVPALRVGFSENDAKNFDLEPDDAGSLLIKRASTGAVEGKIDANGNLLGKVPTFGAYAIPQSVEAGGVIKFQTVQWDTNADYDPSTGIFKPKIPGVYSLKSAARISTAADRFMLSINVTGPNENSKLGTDIDLVSTSGHIIGAACHGDFYFDGVNDSAYVRVNGLYTITTGSGTHTYFSGHLVSADL